MIESYYLKNWMRLLPAAFCVQPDGQILGTDGTVVTVMGPSAQVIEAVFRNLGELVDLAESRESMRVQLEVAKDVADHADDVVQLIEKSCTCGAKDGLAKGDR
jgi:hypothetical protein